MVFRTYRHGPFLSLFFSSIRNPEAEFFHEELVEWNVSHVTIMSSMFQGATAFNKPIYEWDVGNVGTMKNMFGGATAFNQPSAVAAYNTTIARRSEATS
jgi:hypothetical protein